MERQDPLETLSGHVVVCNCNEKVRGIVDHLHNTEVPLDVVVLVQDRKLWDENPAWHPPQGTRGRVFTVEGCPTVEADLLRVRIAHARAAVILADPRQGQLADARSTLVAVAIERHNPQVHTVMELISSASRLQMCAREVNEIICMGDLTEKLLAQSCITPGVKHVFDRLLTHAQGTNQIYLVPLPEGCAGLSYREIIRRAVGADAPFIICGYTRNRNTTGNGKREIVVNPRNGTEPGRDTRLEVGDILITMAVSRPGLEPYLGASATEPPPES
jgi:hypothetical protein